MDSKQVKLSDYANKPRFETDKDMDRQIKESLRTETDAQISEETFAALGGREKVAKLAVPQPSMGVFPLLEMIDSPFLKGDSNTEIKLQQVFEALYVIVKRKDAVSPIYRAFRANERLLTATKSANQSPDFFYVYLRAIAEFADFRSDFDLEVAEFADSLGVFNMLNAIQLINDYLDTSTGGFSMIPAGKSDDKKKDSTSNG